MGSACTLPPLGYTFTAVLLIYSWKNTLQRPSLKPRKGQSMLSKATAGLPSPPALTTVRPNTGLFLLNRLTGSKVPVGVVVNEWPCEAKT